MGILNPLIFNLTVSCFDARGLLLLYELEVVNKDNNMIVQVLRLLQLLTKDREEGERILQQEVLKREERCNGRRERRGDLRGTLRCLSREEEVEEKGERRMQEMGRRGGEQRGEDQRDIQRCLSREEQEEGRVVEELREGSRSTTSSCSSNKERGRSKERQVVPTRVSSLSLGRTVPTRGQREQRGSSQEFHTLSKPLRHSSSHQEHSFLSLSGTCASSPGLSGTTGVTNTPNAGTIPSPHIFSGRPYPDTVTRRPAHPQEQPMRGTLPCPCQRCLVLS